MPSVASLGRLCVVAFVCAFCARSSAGAVPTSDLTGDGVADYWVLQPVHDDSGLLMGSVRVFDGATHAQRFVLVGGEANDGFGMSAEAAGDVDGDGTGDLIVGAPRSQLDGVDAGRAYVFSGVDGALIQTISGTPGAMLGRFATGVGDINGDGKSDLAVASTDDAGSGLRVGRVQLVGGETGVAIASIEGRVDVAFSISGSTTTGADASFGHAVLPIDDMNGDGVVDLAITAPLAQNGVGERGLLYVFFGDVALPGTFASASAAGADREWATGVPGQAFFGHRLAGTDDLDADGVDDVIVASLVDDGTGETVFAFEAFGLGFEFDPQMPWVTVGRPTLPGDLNGDLVVDSEDLLLAATNAGTSVDVVDPFSGDADGDGVLDADDIVSIITDLGVQHPLRDAMSIDRGISFAVPMRWVPGGAGTSAGSPTDCLGYDTQPWSHLPAQVPLTDLPLDRPPLASNCCPTITYDGHSPWSYPTGGGLAGLAGNAVIIDECGPQDDPGSHPNGLFYEYTTYVSPLREAPLDRVPGDNGTCESVCIERDANNDCIRWLTCSLPDGVDPNDTDYVQCVATTADGCIRWDYSPVPGLVNNQYFPERITASSPRPSPLGSGGAMGARASSMTGSLSGEQHAEIDAHAQHTTCNPVLVSDGIKIDSDGDLFVRLPGRDFSLVREYSGTPDAGNASYPWLVGGGWGSNIDGWLRYTPQSPYPVLFIIGGLNLYPDSFEVVTFPAAGYSKFFRQDSTNEFVPFSSGPARITARTVEVRGELVPVWVLGVPGQEQTLFYNTRNDPVLGPLNYRILQRIDAFGNKWTYSYKTFQRAGGGWSWPYIDRVYLNGESEADCAAYVEFEWNTGDEQQPGTGLLDRAAVYRPHDGGWFKTQEVLYTFAGDDPSFAPSGTLHNAPVIVERRMRLDLPMSDASGLSPLGAPTVSAEGEWYSRVLHYRYLGVGGRLSHTFGPEQVEYFADRFATAITGTQGERLRAAAIELATMGVNDALPGDPEGRSVRDLAAKEVTYYSAGDTSRGYLLKELTGMVKQEIVRDGCACSGGALKIDFEYKRRLVFSEQRVRTFPSGTTHKWTPRRWSSVTIRTESIADDSVPGGWRPHKRLENFSEERKLWNREVLFDSELGSGPLTANLSIPVPFVIANRISELEADGSVRQVWHSFHEFDDTTQVRTTKYNSSAIESFAIRPDGLLDFPDNGSVEEAINFRAGGLVEWWEHEPQELSAARLLRQGVARSVGLGSGLSDRITLEEFEYLDASQSQTTRPDLMTAHRRYPLGKEQQASAPPIEVVHQYDIVPDGESLWIDAVHAIDTARPLPSTGPFGSGGFEVTSGYFDDAGNQAIVQQPDGAVTASAFDPTTGVVLATVRNASLAEVSALAPWFSDVSGLVGRHEDGGSLRSYRYADLDGKPLVLDNEDHTLTVLGYDVTPRPGTASLPILHTSAYTRSPVDAPEVSYRGPRAEQWSTAGYNVVDERSFDPIGGGLVAKSQHEYSAFGSPLRSTRWHDIAGDRSHTETFRSDALGRLIEATDANGNITTNTYDVFDRVTSTTMAHDSVPSDTRLLEERFYDDFGSDYTQPIRNPSGAIGGGDGNLSLIRQHVAPGDVRSTNVVHDWRNRQRLSYQVNDSLGLGFAASGMHEAAILDALDRPVETVTLGGGDVQTLIAGLGEDSIATFSTSVLEVPFLDRVVHEYDPRGLPIRRVHKTGSSGLDLETRFIYDAAQRLIAEVPPSGAVTRTRYDGLGRAAQIDVVTGTSMRSNSSFASAIDPENDPVLERTTSAFNTRGLPDATVTAFRAHNAVESAGGLGANPVRTSSATYFDDVARPVTEVVFGSDAELGPLGLSDRFGGGVALASPPEPAPSRMDPVIRVDTAYDASGRASKSIDPLGRTTRTVFDDLGRTVGMVENAVDPLVALAWDVQAAAWSVDGRQQTSPTDQDRVTSYVLDGLGNTIKRVAHDHSSGSERRQITEYVYDPSRVNDPQDLPIPNGSISHNMLYEIRYPNETSGNPSSLSEDIVRYSYNLLGERTSMINQRGVRSVYELDHAGRVTRETPYVSGTDADDRVTSLNTVYDEFGRPDRITSMPSLNFVTHTRDPLGRVTQLGFSPDGGDTHTIDFDFEDTTNGDIWLTRLASMAMPTPPAAVGTDAAIELVYDYGQNDSLADAISRARGFAFESHRHTSAAPDMATATHEYLGLGRRVRSTFTDGAMALTRDRIADAQLRTEVPGVYAGLDKFGRVRSHTWWLDDDPLDTSSIPAIAPPLIALAYAYDDNSNITSRLDVRGGVVAEARDRFFAYDGLNRLVTVDHGSALNPRRGSERWELDAIGNWTEQERIDRGLDPDGDGLLLYDVQVDSAFDETNELRSSFRSEFVDVAGVPTLTTTIVGVPNTIRYDEAGNFVRQPLPDIYAEDGTFVAHARRVMTYDAWNRLVSVELELCDGGACDSGAGWLSRRLAEYTYYPGNQRATRRARLEGNEPYRLVDNGDGTWSLDLSDPNELRAVTHYVYDEAWQLVEERAFEDVSATALPDLELRSYTQYVWDPTSTDDLRSWRRWDAALGDFAEVRWVLDDRNRNVALTLPVRRGGVDVTDPCGADPSHADRVEYSAYGITSLPPVGDVDGDGTIDGDDLTLLGNLASAHATLGDGVYRSDADLDADGDVDADDVLIASANLDHETQRDKLSSVGLNIGFGAGVFDPATGLYLFRNRWYDPHLGRWTTRDPAGYVDGMSLYMYVGGRPTKYFDPFGLMGMFSWWGSDTRPTGEITYSRKGENVYKTVHQEKKGWFETSYSPVDSSPVLQPGLEGRFVKSDGTYQPTGPGNIPDGMAVVEEGNRELAEAQRASVQEGGRQLESQTEEMMAGGLVTATSPMLGRITAQAFKQSTKSSRRLSKNLQNAGFVKPRGYAAHHIVAGNDRRAERARNVLTQFEININDASNGMYLPRKGQDGLPGHNSLHTNDYYNWVNDRFGGIKSREEAIGALSDIRDTISRGETRWMECN
ncbi:MAG: AHH domain-containing protein [Planctomycetota bacterium]